MTFIHGMIVGIILMALIGIILMNNETQRIKAKADGTNHKPFSPFVKLIKSGPFLWLLIVTLVFLALAVVNEVVFHKNYADDFKSFLTSPKTWLAFSKELFFAGFIALVIIVVVEVGSSEEQDERIEKFIVEQNAFTENFRKEQEGHVEKSMEQAKSSVFESIFKNTVDDAVYKEVVDTIFTARFVRESHYRSVVLEPLEGRDDKILMKVRQSYLVKNVTNGPKDSNQKFFIPKMSNDLSHLNRITKMDVTSIEKENKIPKVFPYEYEDGAEHDDIKISTTKSGAEVEYVFPPVHVQQEGKFRVDLEMQMVKDISDNDILTFLSPTLRGNVSVHSLVEDLEVKAISLHRGTLEETPDGDDSFKRWIFNRPMLPFQGYVIMWTKKLHDINELMKK